jgi:hypothetical protein
MVGLPATSPSPDRLAALAVCEHLQVDLRATKPAAKGRMRPLATRSSRAVISTLQRSLPRRAGCGSPSARSGTGPCTLQGSLPRRAGCDPIVSVDPLDRLKPSTKPAPKGRIRHHRTATLPTRRPPFNEACPEGQNAACQAGRRLQSHRPSTKPAPKGRMRRLMVSSARLRSSDFNEARPEGQDAASRASSVPLFASKLQRSPPRRAGCGCSAAAV